MTDPLIVAILEAIEFGHYGSQLVPAYGVNNSTLIEIAREIADRLRAKGLVK